MFPCTVPMLRFRLELGLDTRAMVTIPMGIILMATIPIATTDHIITATMGRHTIGPAGIGTTATTVIITTIGNNVAQDINSKAGSDSLRYAIIAFPTGHRGVWRSAKRIAQQRV